jgi:hypothetical protein
VRLDDPCLAQARANERLWRCPDLERTTKIPVWSHCERSPASISYHFPTPPHPICSPHHPTPKCWSVVERPKSSDRKEFETNLESAKTPPDKSSRTRIKLGQGQRVQKYLARPEVRPLNHFSAHLSTQKIVDELQPLPLAISYPPRHQACPPLILAFAPISNNESSRCRVSHHWSRPKPSHPTCDWDSGSTTALS